MNSSEFLSRIRYSGYLGRVMSAEDAATFIRPGMVLGVSGFTIAGYPKAVAGVLADRARKGEKLDLTVYSGASLGEEFDGELARVGAFRARMPYQTNKDLRNAINAGEVSYVVDLFRAELAKLGAPVDLIQTVEKSSIDATNALMQSVDVVVATGGAGMVRSAYSSGKPALGVGPGNVQVIVDRGVELEEAIPKIISGRIFDNGIICSGEQCVLLPKESFDRAIDIFKQNHVFYVEDADTAKKFADAIFPDNGPINRRVVGQSVQTIAALAGVEVPADTKMILIKARSIGRGEPLCREKMCPVMITAAYDTFEDAVRMAQTDLDYEGKGHTASLHSHDMEHIKYAGEKLTVSRLIVNQPSSTGAGGSLYNGFAPTTTLGCGSWGNNSISENLNYTHLINVSQIGLYNKDAKIPTDEEIWN